MDREGDKVSEGDSRIQYVPISVFSVLLSSPKRDSEGRKGRKLEAHLCSLLLSSSYVREPLRIPRTLQYALYTLLLLSLSTLIPKPSSVSVAITSNASQLPPLTEFLSDMSRGTPEEPFPVADETRFVVVTPEQALREFGSHRVSSVLSGEEEGREGGKEGSEVSLERGLTFRSFVRCMGRLLV